MNRTSDKKGSTGCQRAKHQSPSVSFGGRYISVGPLPLGSDAASLDFVRQIQSFTCVKRSLIEMQGGALIVYFESMEDTATFLETWIFLVDQMASEEAEVETAADPSPVQLRLVEGLSHATLLALKQYLARFGSGGYLVTEDGDGLSFVFVNPQDAILMRQQFAEVFQCTPYLQEAPS
jgi:hypothetical protein